ncbi:MAG: pseudaminic acid synthase [Syntrophaceae bacterium]|nr:pseudaminic acid synthase [Syntrophaceae bacterium]
MNIAGRNIGPGHPVYIIAEMSGNHNGDYHTAEKIVRAAKDSGADAVKLQTYTADTITIDCDSGLFRVGSGNLWSGRTLYDLYQEAYTPWEWQPRLKALAEELGMHCFSSPFDASAADFLEQVDVPAFKIASCELVDLPLIEYVARKGKPMILSTGMAGREEIADALNAVRNAGMPHVALLKCTTAYPSPPEEMNLLTIRQMAEDFGVPVGLSDHSLGIEIPVAAVAVGACIIEKHLVLDRSSGGPDHAFSLEPHEFKAMVDAVRTVEKALGRVQYGPGDQEEASLAYRRSLFVVHDVKKGEVFTPENVRSIRPGHGLPPKYLPDVLGKKAAKDLTRGTPLCWEMIR